MGAPLTSDVLDSPAVAILCALEADGFRVELGPDDAIVIAPKSALTPDRKQQILDHKAAFKTLLRCCDIGVQDRREAFARQLQAAPVGVLVPRLVFRESPYVNGRCHSCGEALEGARWGSCWRCMLARRLACRLPIPVDLLVAYDDARVCT
jgi:hypothetical protein